MFKGLEAKGARFLRGQLALIAAGPGTGKSVFASTLAIKSKVPSLIFSADSDAFTQLTRAICITSDCTVEAASKLVIDDNLSAVADKLKGYPIRFNYDASPTLDTIETSLSAYEEVYGEYPGLVVIDNLTNVCLDGGAEESRRQSLEDLLDYLHDMARRTGSCVLCLHHVTGPYNDSDKPIPLSGVKEQLGRVPELILTMHKIVAEDQPDVLRVSTVKQRSGKADPSGQTFAELEFIGEKVTIQDPAFSPTVWDGDG